VIPSPLTELPAGLTSNVGPPHLSNKSSGPSPHHSPAELSLLQQNGLPLPNPLNLSPHGNSPSSLGLLTPAPADASQSSSGSLGGWGSTPWPSTTVPPQQPSPPLGSAMHSHSATTPPSDYGPPADFGAADFGAGFGGGDFHAGLGHASIPGFGAVGPSRHRNPFASAPSPPSAALDTIANGFGGSGFGGLWGGGSAGAAPAVANGGASALSGQALMSGSQPYSAGCLSAGALGVGAGAIGVGGGGGGTIGMGSAGAIGGGRPVGGFETSDDGRSPTSSGMGPSGLGFLF